MEISLENFLTVGPESQHIDFSITTEANWIGVTREDPLSTTPADYADVAPGSGYPGYGEAALCISANTGDVARSFFAIFQETVDNVLTTSWRAITQQAAPYPTIYEIFGSLTAGSSVVQLVVGSVGNSFSVDTTQDFVSWNRPSLGNNVFYLHVEANPSESSRFVNVIVISGFGKEINYTLVQPGKQAEVHNES